jgi:23S rRNA pseudouridine955/2504/2580 synthase
MARTAQQRPAAAGSGVPNAVQHVKVPEARDGQRLDNLLFNLLKGVPRTHVYRLLRTGQVRVNGKRAKPETRVATGDELRIPPVRLPAVGETPRASERRLARLEDAVLAEDERYLVLDKPSGLASHGGSGIALGAIEQLRQARPHGNLELVHRLDRDTSGVLLLAKKRSALLAAQAAMREGTARKRYLALLVGRMPKPRLRIDAALEKSVLQGGERMVRVDPAGKPSRSEFRLLAQHGDFAYVEVLIDTGRTHQIRVHAAHAGLPVAGDPKYGNAEANRRLRAVGLDRLFLHAAELAFDDAEGRHFAFAAPLPPALRAVLDALAKAG